MNQPVRVHDVLLLAPALLRVVPHRHDPLSHARFEELCRRLIRLPVLAFRVRRLRRLGKKGHCQLHGDPYQAIEVYCFENYCPAKPKVAAGDVYNGGESKAREEAINLWNRRGTL